jgi:hypothetical protein
MKTPVFFKEPFKVHFAAKVSLLFLIYKNSVSFGAHKPYIFFKKYYCMTLKSLLAEKRPVDSEVC